LNINRLDPEKIIDALHQAGYDPVYTATEQEDDLDRVLRDAHDLVVSAGGDGTLRAVSTRLVGRNIPIAPLPMGTANNICLSLGITGKPLDIIAGLSHPIRQRFDIGLVCFPWGNEYFLEGMGFGVFADALAAYRPEEGKSVRRSIASMISTLRNFQTRMFQINLGGQDLSGEYLNVEILNTKLISHRLQVTPQARTDDGLLDVVLLRQDERDSAIDYLTGLVKGELTFLTGAQSVQGRRIDFIWEGWYPLHLDGEVRPMGFQPPSENGSGEPASLKANKAWVTVEALPAALELWLPEGAGKE
jgi:diacylglycerol kinase family enzyme